MGASKLKEHLVRHTFPCKPSCIETHRDFVETVGSSERLGVTPLQNCACTCVPDSRSDLSQPYIVYLVSSGFRPKFPTPVLQSLPRIMLHARHATAAERGNARPIRHTAYSCPWARAVQREMMSELRAVCLATNKVAVGMGKCVTCSCIRDTGFMLTDENLQGCSFFFQTPIWPLHQPYHLVQLSSFSTPLHLNARLSSMRASCIHASEAYPPSHPSVPHSIPASETSDYCSIVALDFMQAGQARCTACPRLHQVDKLGVGLFRGVAMVVDHAVMIQLDLLHLGM